jgi:hypothetical protein
LKKSLTDLLATLPVETEDFLIEQAEEYLKTTLAERDLLKSEVLQHLAGSATKYHLPFSEDMGKRAIQTASDNIGLVWGKPYTVPGVRYEHPEPFQEQDPEVARLGAEWLKTHPVKGKSKLP